MASWRIDVLSVDNLVAKLKERQPDILYVAVVDRNGVIIAHNELARNGARYVRQQEDFLIEATADGATVFRGDRDGRLVYEFSTPINFSTKKIGSFHLGIDAVSLASAQSDARRKVALASGLILIIAIAASFHIGRFFTTPIKKLSEGVSRLKSGSYQGALPVSVRDELGDLTRSFNEMAQVITDQQEKLEEYALGLEESYLATVKILATSIDARDDYTLQHSTRVAALSVMLRRKAGSDC